MRAVMVMFDSLNRHMLPAYGCSWIKAPNFKRLQERTVVFDNAYISSMPCMPARREIHTGRYNFLHRSWGPLEPFDRSMPELLKRQGIYTHLVTDHYHYFEDGGATYHHRYNSWEFFRGQEYDTWKGHVDAPQTPPHLGHTSRQYLVNREYLQSDCEMPMQMSFDAGLAFLEKNKAADNWFLQLETFDPHEPFYVTEEYKKLYPHAYDGPLFDWPPYDKVKESPEAVEHMRLTYAALLSFCDKQLGRVLDFFDRHDLWKDTLLIVNTDHGYMLGEHDWWAKCRQPFYRELANTPLFIWDPRCGKRNERRTSLVQTIDLAPTLLEYFGVERPTEMLGQVLRETIANDTPVREAGLFGIHGGHVNVTDGRYVYMRAPVRAENTPLFEYTLMPTHMRTPFEPWEFSGTELHAGFSFTQNCPVLKIPARPNTWIDAHSFGHLLWDLEKDPEQRKPLQDPQLELKMIGYMKALMRLNEAPPEQFERLGL